MIRDHQIVPKDIFKVFSRICITGQAGLHDETASPIFLISLHFITTTPLFHSYFTKKFLNWPLVLTSAIWTQTGLGLQNDLVGWVSWAV